VLLEEVLDRSLRDAVALCQLVGTGAGAVAAEDVLYLFVAEGVSLRLENRRTIGRRFLRDALLTAAYPVQDVGDGVRQFRAVRVRQENVHLPGIEAGNSQRVRAEDRTYW
jgi:hypothetical protein